MRGVDAPYAATGATALCSLRRHLAATSSDPNRKDLPLFLEYGAYTRADNANYLRDAFALIPPLLGVADCLEQASRSYAAMVAAFAGGGDPTPTLLAELDCVAERENEAGRLLLEVGSHTATAVTAGPQGLDRCQS